MHPLFSLASLAIPTGNGTIFYSLHVNAKDFNETKTESLARGCWGSSHFPTWNSDLKGSQYWPWTQKFRLTTYSGMHWTTEGEGGKALVGGHQQHDCQMWRNPSHSTLKHFHLRVSWNPLSLHMISIIYSPLCCNVTYLYFRICACSDTSVSLKEMKD